MFSPRTIRKQSENTLQMGYTTLTQNFISPSGRRDNAQEMKIPMRKRRNRFRIFSQKNRQQERNDQLRIRKLQSIKISPQKMRVKINKADTSEKDFDSLKKIRLNRPLSPKMQALSFNVKKSYRKKLLARNGDLSIVLSRAPAIKTSSDPLALKKKIDSRFLMVKDPFQSKRSEKIESIPTNCSSHSPTSQMAPSRRKIKSPIMRRLHSGDLSSFQFSRFTSPRKMPRIDLFRGNSLKSYK